MGHSVCFGIILLVAFLPTGSSLTAQFDWIARKAAGRVGAAVSLIGEKEISGLRLGERFPMASVFKLPVGMAVLRKVDQGKLSLDQKVVVRKSDFVPSGSYSAIRDQHPAGNFEISVRELLRVMMCYSDGTACDVLLRIAGGPAAVTEYVRSLKVKEVVVETTQKGMYGSPQKQQRNWATPRGLLELLRALQTASLSPARRDLLLQFMAESATGPGRIKGLLPPGTVVSHKTGSLGARAINDVGIVTLPDGRRLGIAVFVSGSQEPAAERFIAEIARAAWDHYTAK